jgi:hypothetical protein
MVVPFGPGFGRLVAHFVVRLSACQLLVEADKRYLGPRFTGAYHIPRPNGRSAQPARGLGPVTIPQKHRRHPIRRSQQR